MEGCDRIEPHPLVKYLTEEFVQAMDKRLTTKSTDKIDKKKENKWVKWFGMIPLSLYIFIQKRKR
ncbi:YqzE family protein [Aliibacillus thermotolerans]|uniref:YqzE family protein n=1 Tax=Aliibacillus thermotolerans TaxID=1834418 RepID=A0ABW0UA95_9BACI|nr:YqzE family protein [Aliibacillus thermotolerans]MDA3131108.1 YqzE family protein [Aliibacillus thermotolerans]